MPDVAALFHLVVVADVSMPGMLAGEENAAGCVMSRENTRKNCLKIPMSPRVFFPSVFAA
jgi:hypothetical protein